VELRAEGLRPGMYFYRLRTPSFTSVRRVVLLR
jgi:hypothetical protein